MNKYFKMAILLLFIFGFSFFVSCNKDKPSDDDGNTPTEKKEYLLVYDTTFGSFSDGKTYLEQKYEEGTKVQLIQDEPIRDGYEFAGWINQETKEQVSNPFTINKDTVLEANWVLKKVKITYDAMAGNFEDGSYQKVIYVEQNSPFEYLEIPTNGSRLFNGWYDYETGNYVEEGTIVTQDLTVNAKYRNPGEQYNVNYIINGGTQDLPLVDTYYNQIIYRLSVPTKEGFEFLGWYKSSDFSGEPIKYQTEDCTGDQTYYAKWEIVDANYAEVILDEILPLEIDKDINLPIEYQGASLYWSSSNYDIMTARGKINQTHRNEAVTISVEMTINDELYKFERDVVVKAIAFDELINPVAGYFYRTNVVTKSEALMNNLDIVYYAFANVSSNGAVSIEGVVNFNKLMEEANYLRQNGIRIVLSIAGGADNFSSACRNIGYAKLADNIIELIKEYHLDGVDIDWEFPTDETDRNNMAMLCQSLRKKLTLLEDGNGSSYLVTAAIPSHQSYLKFNFKLLNESLDYVNMMSYDMNLAGRATHLCPLFKANNDGNIGYGIDQGVKWFTDAGLDKDKIIIGAAFYGKAYKVTGQSLGSKYPGLGAMAELYHMQYQSGTVTYSYIYDNILPNRKYVRYFDEDARVPYLYNEEESFFITYEDEQSLIEKVNYAYQEGLGIMFWDYSYDTKNILTDTICNRMQELRG